jgi:integrase
MTKTAATAVSKKASKKDLQTVIHFLTAGALPYFNSIFLKIATANPLNADILCQFLAAEKTESNVKLNTTITHIKIIYLFNRFLDYKHFQQVSKDDIAEYLGSLRKTEDKDPNHKWIGTYNSRQGVLMKFFRWLYNQNEPDSNKWITPPCMQGIRQLLRKEKSPYKPSDIWTSEEHALFLKYCPEKRDKCFHSMANDTSARPHELLSLRIKDVKFKLSSTGKTYAEINILESKTKPRTLPLIFSIPYVKEWINSHPMRNRPDAFLFPSLADSNFGQRLTEDSLYKQYTRKYQKCYFPSLLKESSIPEVDKAFLRNLLTKPWNPYIQSA